MVSFKIKRYSLEESISETPIYHGPVEFPINILKQKKRRRIDGLITI